MEEDWNDEEGEELSNLILLETPSVSHLPCSVRYRAFTDSAVDNKYFTREIYWRKTFLHHNSCSIYKRRRLEEAVGGGSEVPDVRPMLKTLKDSINKSRRQFETLRWLEESPRGAEEINFRLLLDRRLGVRPSLAVLHRALTRLKYLHKTEFIADIAEDIVMDSPVLSLWTLLQIVEGLKEQPQRAARIAFSLSPLVINGKIPTSVWSSLCCELDKVARQMSAPLERSLVELFGQVLYRVRDDGLLSEAIVVYYGQALLKSRAPLHSIIGFVKAELLSGRNSPPNDAVSEMRLSAFLSDLIEAMCGDSGYLDEREEGPPLVAEERLLYCSDLIKYAYAKRLQLTQTAFDAFLRFCDDEKDYHRLCIVFVAMCALSTPTLISTTRIAEVLCDLEELSKNFSSLLRQPSPSIFLYVLMRYGVSSLFPIKNNENNNRELLELYFCECVAKLCVRDGDVSLCMNIFASIIEVGKPTGVQAFISELVRKIRFSNFPIFSGNSMMIIAENLEPFNLEALYYSLLPLSSLSTTPGITNISFTLDSFRTSIQSQNLLAYLFNSRDDNNNDNKNFNGVLLNIERALSGLFKSSQVYGIVIDESSVFAFANSPALAEAFVKMMSGYAVKTGAVALISFEVCTSKQLTDVGRKMLVKWLLEYNWLVILPLSITLQLLVSSLTSSKLQEQELCIRLFQEVRRMGHTKVAFITDLPNIAEKAKVEGVHPVIMISELQARLGIH